MQQNNPRFALSPYRPMERADSIDPVGLLSAMPGISDGCLWSMLGTTLAPLMPVTIFDGYDVTIFNLCTPDIAKMFHPDDHAAGTMAPFVRLGGGMISSGGEGVEQLAELAAG
jgi:hypothetical protein